MKQGGRLQYITFRSQWSQFEWFCTTIFSSDHSQRAFIPICFFVSYCYNGYKIHYNYSYLSLIISYFLVLISWHIFNYVIRLDLMFHNCLKKIFLILFLSLLTLLLWLNSSSKTILVWPPWNSNISWILNILMKLDWLKNVQSNWQSRKSMPTSCQKF